MQAFQQNLSKLEAADTQVLGVSMDSPFSNKAWAEKIGVTFPLLSDWGGDVTKEYGLYNPKYKAARRVNYLIDKDGKVIEMQLDSEAIDPTKVVVACQAGKWLTGTTNLSRFAIAWAYSSRQDGVSHFCSKRSGTHLVNLVGTRTGSF